MILFRRASPFVLSGLLAGAGLAHFVKPEFFDKLIPPFLGNATAWVYGSGVAELACALAVAAPSTRRRGALASAALLVAVFPGNVYMAVSPGDVPRWIALARLPLQVPLVLWALQVGEKLPSTGRSRSRRG